MKSDMTHHSYKEKTSCQNMRKEVKFIDCNLSGSCLHYVIFAINSPWKMLTTEDILLVE